jgi:hypothetical protein
MGYKLLGLAVWKGARWYMGRRFGRLIPSRRVLTGALVVTVVSGLAVAATRRNDES